MSDEDKTIFCFTADKIGYTGKVSFKYLFDMKPGPDKKEMAVICHVPFGYLWIPEPRDISYSFNIWQNGSMLVGGGFMPDDLPEWKKELLSNIPSCSLLMTTAVFDWFRENVLEVFDRPYKRYHSLEPLFTS